MAETGVVGRGRQRVARLTDMEAQNWRHVQDLFTQLVALSPSERERRLDTLAAGQRSIAEEVRSLLAAHDAETTGALDRVRRTIEPLQDALKEEVPDRVGPFTILEEAGRGGMGVVYRAHDPRLQRSVALKFLPRPLLQDADAQQRFIDEARAASALDHPHICTIHDIGSVADGRLYIAMAWYDGGTLADRLRSGPLDVRDAVRIAIQVAEALERAHRAGLVHRDIKPANIAFGENDQVKVLDFGIASLEASSARPAGTPRYMAPEQLRGEPVDRRADIWSLGAVLHEMLAGTPAPARMERAANDELPALTRGVPARLRAVIARALAPDPAQRFAGAGELAAELRAIYRGRPRARRMTAAALALVAASALFLIRLRPASPAVDDRVVAVLPFRISGDSSLSWLREGMVDLLSAKLTVEGGLRAADPRAVHSAWRRSADPDAPDPTADAAAAVADDIGAGNILLGEVVGTADAVIVNTTISNLRGRVLGRASVQGTLQELPALVDRIVAELLSLSAGEEPQRVASLTSTSLPALRAFLEGQAAYRRGDYHQALRRHGHALELDSTFALAGLGVELAGGWIGAAEEARVRARAAAWRHRARMSGPDQALLNAVLGPMFPAPSSPRAVLDAIEQGLRLSPDRVELWYLQADAYFHFGRALGFADWETRAQNGFRRALALDSAFAAPLHHLVALYARRGDVTRMNDVAALALALEPAGATADHIRWRTAAAASLPLPPLEDMQDGALAWIAMSAQDDGIEPDHAWHALRLRTTRPGTRAEHYERHLALHAAALNRGSPREAVRATIALEESQPDPGFVLRLRILDALWAGGDSSVATFARTRLESVRAPSENLHRLNRCVLDQWRLVHDSLVPEIPAPRAATDSMPVIVCEAVVDGLREVNRAPGESGEATVRLYRMIDNGVSDLPLGDGHLEYAGSAAAHVLERAGQPARALAVIRRRIYFLGWQSNLAQSLLHEARLAETLGDTAGAVDALRHFLALRAGAEDTKRAEMEQARARLARFSGSR